jgi:myosin heavy subunit
MSKKDSDSLVSTRSKRHGSISDTSFRSNSPAKRMETASKSNICHICKQKFSLMFKKKDCIECRLPVCMDDSGGNNVPDAQRICNFCYKENLKNNFSFENKDTLEKLIRDLTAAKKESEKKKNEILQQENNFKQLESTLKNNLIKFEQTVKNLSEKIKQEKDRNERVEESSKSLNRSVEETRLLERNMEDRLMKGRGELEFMKINARTLENERDAMDAELAELKEVIEKQVPLQMIRNVVCKICFRKVKYSFRSTLEGNNMIEGSTFTPIQRRKKRPDEMIRDACCKLF